MKILCARRSVLFPFLCLAAMTAGLGAADSTTTTESKVALPRLVDLGADKCIPCKMMAPILAELTKGYAGRLEVVFIDVWKSREAGERYGVRIIPTQIFYDATGKELFRHEGFFAKKDIIAKWRELGIEFKKPDGEKSG